MMLLRTLVRLPSPGFDENQFTGDAKVDAFLRSLDAELVGSKTVRNLTLEEAKDHILSAKQALIAAGESDEVASEQAVASFGPEAEHGASQRQERSATFYKMMLSMGLPFATMMSLFNLLNSGESGVPWWFHLVTFLFYFVFFGAGMGYIFTFCFAQAKPTQSCSTLQQGEVLEVFSPRLSKVMAVGLAVIMLVLGALSALGVLGIGFMAYNHLLVNIFLVYIAIGMVIASPVAFNRYLLDGQSLTIKTPFRSRQLELAQFVAVQPVTGWRRWLRIDLGQPHQLRFRCGQGKESITYLVINGEMHNSDQLLAVLNSKMSAQAAV